MYTHESPSMSQQQLHGIAASLKLLVLTVRCSEISSST